MLHASFVTERAPISLLLSFLFLTTLLTTYVQGQQSTTATNDDTGHAIELYRRGNFGEAVKLLQVIVKKRPDDADAWYYLGLAFHNQGCISCARPAFEQYVKLRPDSPDVYAKLSFAFILANDQEKALATASRALELGAQSAEPHYAMAEAHLRQGAAKKALEEADAALLIDPKFTSALLTKSLAYTNLNLYSEAAETLERYLAESQEGNDPETWRSQLGELHQRIASGPNLGSAIFAAKDVTEKARILSKPEPQYSEAARKAGVAGMVSLRAVFSVEGELKHILITRALGYGLTTQAVQAARQIRFNPAMKDGVPVSMAVQIEYNFSLY